MSEPLPGEWLQLGRRAREAESRGRIGPAAAMGFFARKEYGSDLAIAIEE